MNREAIMKGKQAKFRVDQVVQAGTTGQYRRITRVFEGGDVALNGAVFWRGYNTRCLDSEDLLPLTAREIGYRPARRKGKR